MEDGLLIKDMDKFAIISNDLVFIRKIVKSFGIKCVIYPIEKNGLNREKINNSLKIRFPFNKVLVFDFKEKKVLGQFLRLNNITSCIVYSMPYLISLELLNLFEGTKLNLHPSKLPFFRGPNPIMHQIINNQDIYITLHEIDEGEDTGDILLSIRVDINSLDDYRNLNIKIYNTIHRILRKYQTDLINNLRTSQRDTSNSPRAKRLTNQYLINLVQSTDLEFKTILKILLYRNDIFVELLNKKSLRDKFYSFKIDLQNKSKDFISLDKGKIHYTKHFHYMKLLTYLIKSIKNIFLLNA